MLLCTYFLLWSSIRDIYSNALKFANSLTPLRLNFSTAMLGRYFYPIASKKKPTLLPAYSFKFLAKPP